MIWAISLGIAGAFLQGLELVSLRPRPFDVQQLAGWEGYAAPSIPIGAIAILSIGVAFTLVPPGRYRYWAKLAAAGAIAITGVLRIYLGVDHFSDAVFGVIVGVAIPLAAFRAFAPNDLSAGRVARRDVAAWRRNRADVPPTGLDRFLLIPERSGPAIGSVRWASAQQGDPGASAGRAQRASTTAMMWVPPSIAPGCAQAMTSHSRNRSHMAGSSRSQRSHVSVFPTDRKFAADAATMVHG